MDLSITIVSFKSKELVKKLLDSILDSRISYSWEVIVVDNGSNDGTVEALRSEYQSRPEWKDKLQVIAHTNVGFGKGHNEGLTHAKGDFWLVLNPDTKLEPNTIQELMFFLQARPNVGIVTPKLVKGDGTLEPGCRRNLPNPWNALSKVLGLAKLFPNNKRFASYNMLYASENEQTEIEACSGSFMLISPACKRAVKGFDQDFFMYGEDLDICLRARQAGFKIWYYPKVTATHYKGQSTKQVSFWMLKEFYRAQWIYYQKHFAKSYNSIFNGLIWVAIWGLYSIKLFLNIFRREKFVSK